MVTSRVLHALVIIGSAFGFFSRASELSKSADSIIPLEPNLHLPNQILEIDNEEARYLPSKLKPSRSYEVRISYPATNSVQIAFDLHCGKASPRASRKLLTAEKLVFSTNKDGAVVMSPGRKCKDGEAPVVTVRANAWALTVIQVPKRELHYDIVLEENMFGVPVSGSLVILLVVLSIMSILLIMPYWITYVKRTQKYLTLGEKQNTS